MGVYPGRKVKRGGGGDGFFSFLPHQLQPSSEKDRPWRLFKKIVKDGQSLTALQVLNDETIEAHLHVMFNFSNLLDSLDRCARRHRGKLERKGDPVPEFLASGWLVKEFLSHAERKYMIWLEAMGSDPSLAYQCPPWDVEMIYYAHHLSPAKFLKDLRQYRQLPEWPLLRTNVSFPNAPNELDTRPLISSNPSSETWNRVLPDEPFNPWGLSLAEDFSDILRISIDDLQSCIPKVCCPQCGSAIPSHTWQTLRAAESPRPCLAEGCDGYIDREKLFPKFRKNLVTSVLRQRRFWRVMLSGSSPWPWHETVERMRSRYFKFMSLMRCRKVRNGGVRALVPTNEIDLIWHTHLLFPERYRLWCLKHFGRLIEHTESASKEDIEHGWEDTLRLWDRSWQGEFYGDSKDKPRPKLDLAPLAVGDFEFAENSGYNEDDPDPYERGYVFDDREDELLDIVSHNYWVKYLDKSWYREQVKKRRTGEQSGSKENGKGKEVVGHASNVQQGWLQGVGSGAPSESLLTPVTEAQTQAWYSHSDDEKQGPMENMI